MATLVISAAVNIGIGLALNALFPPPDIVQEGPRLTDLGFTSAAYGQFVNITFGTDRLSGVIVDTTDPPVTEEVDEESERVGKGGGQRVTSVTHTYFFTGSISFGVSGAASLLRLWGDGKLIYDATGNSEQILKEGATLTFYPGGEDQQADPEEQARREAVNTPAYRHLTRIKLDRLPLADFANRIPNFTAEITYATDVTLPITFLALDEPGTGLDVPSATGGGRFMIDRSSNVVAGLKNSATGTWVANTNDLQHRITIGADGLTEPVLGVDGFLYAQTGNDNAAPLQKRDIETGALIAQIGGAGIDTGETGTSFGNFGVWSQMSRTTSGVGIESYLVHLNSFTDQGSIVRSTAGFAIIGTFGAADGLASGDGFAVSDHERGIFYLVVDAPGTQTQILRLSVTAAKSSADTVVSDFTLTQLRLFTRGGAGNFQNVASVVGWALHEPTGNVLLSNGFNTILYDPASDTILASRQDIGFDTQNNYVTENVFAFSNTSALSGQITILDPRTLGTLRTIDTNLLPWPGGPGDPDIADATSVWEPLGQSLILSRVTPTSAAPVDGRVLRIFVNRVGRSGVTLEFATIALCTEYQSIEGAGLAVTDLSTAPLAADTLEGYTINRRSTVRQAFEPLRTLFFFDGVQSDWLIKFTKRGGSSVLTIPNADIGRANPGATEPTVRQNRTQDSELPMRVSIRYKNGGAEYDPDVEHTKRHRFPTPTMGSRNEETLDLPLVSNPQTVKRATEQWLFDLWTERVQLNTIIPWTYLELDPGDVFQMEVLGETLSVRMLEADIGTALAMDITAVVQDARDFTSSTGAGSSLGFVAPTVPSGLLSRLILLDAPNLSLSDLNLSGPSAAYIAVAGVTATWPGATVMKSIDDIDYVPVGAVTSEAAVAKVTSGPGSWLSTENNFRNRFQEVIDGGTMRIVPLRRASAWATATELAVLNGANAFAVVTSNGVEVIQYQTATALDTGEIRLDRLLRGRLGTEDIVNLGNPASGDEIVLLSTSTGVSEAAPIVNQSLPVSSLSNERFFRAVTIGTLIESVTPKSLAYTGRDLRPYAPAHVDITPNVSGAITVTWLRRTRGAGGGELLNLTGTVPLNETLERYEVTLSTAANPDFVTKTVDNATTVDFTSIESAPGFAPSDQLVPGTVDGDFATNPAAGGSGWTVIGNVPSWGAFTAVGGIAAPPTASGNSTFAGFVTGSTLNNNSINRILDLVSDLSTDPALFATSFVFFNVWCAQGNGNGDLLVRLDVLDVNDTELATATTGEFDPVDTVGDGNWMRVGTGTDLQPFNALPLMLPLNQVGAARVRVRLECDRSNGGNGQGFDVARIGIAQPASDLIAKVVQLSGTGLKSPDGIGAV